jgi:hypothetical protein
MMHSPYREADISNNSALFVEPKGLLPRWQELVTFPCSEPEEISPHSRTCTASPI